MTPFTKPLPFDFTFDAGDLVIAAGATTTGVMTINSEHGFLWDKLNLWSTDNSALSMQISDEDAGRTFSNALIPVDLIAGDGRYPYYLPQKTFLTRRHVLVFHVNNSSGAPVTCRPVLRGFKVAPEQRGKLETLGHLGRSIYWHHRAFALAAAIGDEDTQLVEVANEADFLWSELQSDILADWNLEVRATSEGVLFQNETMPIESIAGNGQRPGRLSVARRLKARSTLHFKAINRTAVARAPQIVLGGTKLW